MAIIIDRMDIYRLIEVGHILNSIRAYNRIIEKEGLNEDLKSFGKLCEYILNKCIKDKFGGYTTVTDMMNYEEDTIVGFILDYLEALEKEKQNEIEILR